MTSFLLQWHNNVKQENKHPETAGCIFSINKLNSADKRIVITNKCGHNINVHFQPQTNNVLKKIIEKAFL